MTGWSRLEHDQKFADWANSYVAHREYIYCLEIIQIAEQMASEEQKNRVLKGLWDEYERIDPTHKHKSQVEAP